MASEEPKQAIVSNTEEQVVVVVTDEGANVAPPRDKEEEEASTETKNVVDNAKGNDEDEVTSNVKNETVTDTVTAECNELPESEKKALSELKLLIQTALLNHEYFVSPPQSPPLPQSQQPPQVEDVPPAVADEEAEKNTEEKTKEENIEEEVGNSNRVTIDEDGTKTFEAIEETVVVQTAIDNSQKQQQQTQDSCAAVSSPSAEQQEAKTDTIVEEDESETHQPLKELSIYGVPLFKDERTDTILWKFLRARDFKVNEAFVMFKSTLKWRKEFKIEELLEEDLGDDLEKAVFMEGFTKEGNPVCYNVYGAFQDKELYQTNFCDEEKRQRFLKWRIQFLEKSIRKLDFHPGGISTILQVYDLKNSPGPGKWELRQATKQALNLLQDNYPEFVAKQVFINVPWWYVAVNKMINPFLTQRTKSKFVVAGPSKSAETLFSYIGPEQVPVEYGGFSKRGYETKDGATQIIVKPGSKQTVEFAVTQACELTWEVRVVGWEVSYGAEFVPNAKDAYTVIIQKLRKVGPTQESIITNTFKTSQLGKVVLSIHNSSSKKKTLLYRFKSNTSRQ